MNRREKPHATRTPTRRQSRHPTSDHVPIWRSRLQPPSVEPRVDSFRDNSPSGLEHHVVSHIGEEFGFGAICTCRCVHFVRRDPPSHSAPNTRSGVVTRSGLSRFGKTVSRRAVELSSCSCAAMRTTSGSGVCAQKKASRASVGVFNPGNCLPVMAALIESHGCRFILRTDAAADPPGGNDASSTAAGASCDSRYFGTTKDGVPGAV